MQFTRLSISLLGLPAGTPVIPLNRVDMRAANPGASFELLVNDEALLLFDLPNRPTGQTHISAGGDHLTVSNIGSSGKDGVGQDPLPPGTRQLVHHLQFPDPLPPEWVLRDVSGLSLDGLPPGKPVVRTVELPPGAVSPQLTVNYAAIGAPSSSVQLFLAGQLIFRQSGMTGPLAEFPMPPLTFGYDAYDRLLSWPQPVPVSFPGGPTIQADEVRVSPDAAGPGLPVFGQIDFVVHNFGGVPVVDLGLAYPAPCPWDCGDTDGIVGINDFLALLAQWGGPGTCDFDGDGIIGINEFLSLLANWGPCP